VSGESLDWHGEGNMDPNFISVGVLLWIFSMFFMMAIGWRIMRAVEKTAAATERLALGDPRARQTT